MSRPLKLIDSFYTKDRFIDEAKYSLLRNTAMEVPYIASFAIYHVAKIYIGIKQVIFDFKKGKEYKTASSQASGPG